MMQPALSTERLEAVSAFSPPLIERGRQLEWAWQADGDLPVRHCVQPQVMFFPALRLQVLDGCWVSNESLTYPEYLAFEKGRQMAESGAPWAQDFHADTLEEEVAVLSGFYSRNYFHWVTEELFKAYLLEHNGFTGRYVVNQLPAFAHESLGLLGIGPDRILDGLERPVLLRGVHLLDCLHAMNVRSRPALLKAFRQHMVTAAEQQAGTAIRPRRVWSVRQAMVNNSSRAVTNEADVWALLKPLGFEPFDFGGHSVVEQIAVASQLECLAGPHGAGFVQALFMPEGSHVIECYSPRHINPGMLGISDVLNHQYHMLVGDSFFDDYPHNMGVAVSTDHLQLALRALSR